MHRSQSICKSPEKSEESTDAPQAPSKLRMTTAYSFGKMTYCNEELIEMPLEELEVTLLEICVFDLSLAICVFALFF